MPGNARLRDNDPSILKELRRFQIMDKKSQVTAQVVYGGNEGEGING